MWLNFFFLRMGKPFDEAFGQSFSYTQQSQMMIAIPMFRTTVHEKWFLTFKFLQNFFMGSIFVCFFSTQLISPRIKLVSDHEMSLVKGFHPGPITNFGIGEPCLNELKQGFYFSKKKKKIVLHIESRQKWNWKYDLRFTGLYLRRGCFLTCDVAKY